MDKVLQQRSMEWRELRCGNITASQFHRILKTPRAVPAWAGVDWLGASAASYMEELLWERASGQPSDRASTHQMRYGQDFEDQARDRAVIELQTRFGRSLELPEGDFAYIAHPDHEGIGFSPDGMVLPSDTVEIKNPYQGARHVRSILEGDFLTFEHRCQVQGGLWITGGKVAYVVSYDHRCKPRPFHMMEVPRHDIFIERELAPKILQFQQLLNELYDQFFTRLPLDEAPF